MTSVLSYLVGTMDSVQLFSLQMLRCAGRDSAQDGLRVMRSKTSFRENIWSICQDLISRRLSFYCKLREIWTMLF
ncbi:hypothetical protein J437_LFUL010906 [Ladona fulva]|uniref:Uncharacterized protein n=1 Tax=Ladona fulva TaxID=123851 RepID=A0A8K0KBP0_LADFU|nr:hypothetical protein J437_LFUL010906 [Ladona fulva]